MAGLFDNMASSARAMISRLSPARFAAREDGTVTAFAVMIFVLMVGVSGIAIDVMRFETQRAQLQYTLDRAILAAASLTQPYDPEGVVRDYFEISGIEDYRLDVRVEQGLNFRRVHAYAELEVRSLFMQMFGVRVMSSPAIGAAEERVNQIEVSMVLDISGSMGSNNRMTNLRPAARDFVTEVLSVNINPTTGEASENLVSISIVPYNGRVNAGALIGSVFTFDDTHNYSNCAHFEAVNIGYSWTIDDGDWDASNWPASDFTTTTIDPAVPIPRIAHYDRDDFDDDDTFDDPDCQTDQYGAILPWQHDEDVLHTHINSLGTGGWTAIDAGMNWGVGLLDPAAAPALQGLVASGDVSPDFSDRPAIFNDGDPDTREDDETIKVVVLMTDGANTNQYDLRDQYYRIADPSTGLIVPRPSPVFYLDGNGNGQYDGYPSSDQISVWWEDRGQFWIPANDPRDASGSWSATPYGTFAPYGMTSVEWFGESNLEDRILAYMEAVDTVTGLGVTPTGHSLLWPDLFAEYTGEWISEEYFEEPARASGDWSYHDDFLDDAVHRHAYEHANPNPSDVNLRAICDAARAADIVVFTIGFEAPSGGQEVMRYCATTDAHYYDVDGLEIAQAFENIARAINQLRLIQ